MQRSARLKISISSQALSLCLRCLLELDCRVMAKKEAAQSAQVSSAKDDRDPPKGLPRRSSKGSRKMDGQSADAFNAAPDSSARVASIQAKDTPAPARRPTYVPLHSSASAELACGRDSVPRDTVPAKQPARNRRCECSGIPLVASTSFMHHMHGMAVVTSGTFLMFCVVFLCSSPREAAESGDLTADGAGQQPGAKHKRGQGSKRWAAYFPL